MFKKRWICVALLLAFVVITGCARAPQETITEPTPSEVERVIEAVKATVVVGPDSTLAIRNNPGTKDKPEDDVLDRVPGGRILVVKDKHENTIMKDGYTWWEVEDSSTGTAGWAAADFLEEK
ncbi:MAG: hypothetical protein Q7J85_00160 [Bacillota bacterium]|nr:hypothetical protein [Bacillota bacterium]